MTNVLLEYETRHKKRIGYLSSELIKRDSLLRQYSTWLESSEAHTIHKGGDVYNMLIGAMHAIDGDLDFIPGTGWQNFVAVISKVQKETGLDLGVCQFLVDRPNSPTEYPFSQTGKIPDCGAKEDLMVGSLSVCIPPNRVDCPHRIRKLEELASKSKTPA